MNHADGLLASILEQPEETATWSVLSDWLEEQGDPTNLARAELLRLQTQWAAAQGKAARQKALDQKAAALFQQQPGLAGALKPLLDSSFPVLAVQSALALFLLADLTSVVEGPLVAGTTWEGELQQSIYTFPTTLWVRKRTGNKFEGYMKEDFSSMYGRRTSGRFYFRGAIAGRQH
jgi:uncharacterized protein (TIGR02996 family)